MPIRLSRCVAILTAQPEQALQHYQSWLGLRSNDTLEGVEIDTGSLKIFIDQGQRNGTLFELLVDDLDHARADLRRRGFFELAWRGPGKPNLVRDPFGIEWNIHQGEITESWPSLDATPSPIPPKLIILSQDAKAAAEFYAMTLAEPATQSPAGWIIDSGPIRILIEPGIPTGSALCVDSTADGVDTAQTEALFGGKSIAVDPFGVTWKRLLSTELEHAVTNAEA